jgi:hypothetical protein
MEEERGRTRSEEGGKKIWDKRKEKDGKMGSKGGKVGSRKEREWGKIGDDYIWKE